MKFTTREDGQKLADVWVGMPMTEEMVEQLKAVAKAEGQENFRTQLAEEITAYLQERLPGRYAAAAEILKTKAEAPKVVKTPEQRAADRQAALDRKVEELVQQRLAALRGDSQPLPPVIFEEGEAPELEEVETSQAQTVVAEATEEISEPHPSDDSKTIVKRLRAKRARIEAPATSEVGSGFEPTAAAA